MVYWLDYLLIVLVLQLLLYSSFRLSKTLARRRALLLDSRQQQDAQLNETVASRTRSQAPATDTTTSTPRLFTIATVVMTANAGNPARPDEREEPIDDFPPSYDEIILSPPVPVPKYADTVTTSPTSLK